MRAYAAHSNSARANVIFEAYLQTSYGGGFSWVGTDLTYLLRALLVSSTLGGDMVALHKLTPPYVWAAQNLPADRHNDSHPDFEPDPVARGEGGDEGSSVSKADADTSADDNADSDMDNGAGLPDQPELRRRIRWWSNIATLVSLGSLALSMVAGTLWQNAVGGGYVGVVRPLLCVLLSSFLL